MPDASSSESSRSALLAGSMELLDGSSQDLSEYLDRVVLAVNTASRCGLTPQYEGLQELYEGRRGRGLVVLGFPADDFMGQEPGGNDEIAEFCQVNYGVGFPMFAKSSVLGEGANPLFRELSRRSRPPSWNFTKYLIDREGRLAARFDPPTAPDDPALIEAIERILWGLSVRRSRPAPG